MKKHVLGTFALGTVVTVLLVIGVYMAAGTGLAMLVGAFFGACTGAATVVDYLDQRRLQLAEVEFSVSKFEVASPHEDEIELVMRKIIEQLQTTGNASNGVVEIVRDENGNAVDAVIHPDHGLSIDEINEIEEKFS